MVQFYLLPIPPGNPGDKFSPAGVGNCLKRSCPGGTGRGKSKITSCCSCKVPCLSVDTMAPDRVEKTAYFQGKSLEFVADWLEKKNLSKFKCVRRYVYYKLLNECAFDAYSNEWRSSQTKKYFFSVFIFIIRQLK